MGGALGSGDPQIGMPTSVGDPKVDTAAAGPTAPEQLQPIAKTTTGPGGGQVAALGATALGAGLLGGSGAYAAGRKARDDTDGSELVTSTGKPKAGSPDRTK
jgi:hypothetical protein